MKKNLKKILILLILFVLAAAGYFTWSWMQLREDGAVYTSIEDANLPVAYVNILGRRMNELDGFGEESQKDQIVEYADWAIRQFMQEARKHRKRLDAGI